MASNSYIKKFDVVCAEARQWIKNVEFAFSQLNNSDCGEAKNRFYNFMDNITHVISKEVKGAALQCLDFAQQVDPNVKIVTPPTEKTPESLSVNGVESKTPPSAIKRKKRKLSSDVPQIINSKKPLRAAEFPNLKDECPICFKTIRDVEELKNHFNSKHENTGQKTAMCHCGKRFYDMKFYLAHFKKKHGDKPRNVCPICSKQVNESKLVLHLRSHFHKYKCDLCPKFLHSKENLMSHRNQHLREIPEPCKCRVCGEKFFEIPEYEDHMATAHAPSARKAPATSTDDGDQDVNEEQRADDSEPMESRAIGSPRDTKTELSSTRNASAEKESSEDEANKKEVQCQVCGKTFRSSASLNIHFGMLHKKTHTP